MTVVYDSGNGNSEKTHVLIVGVGEYPQLDFHSGNKWRSKFPGLDPRLSSAVESAKILADWFIGTCDNPDAPLGTVELLVTDRARLDYTAPQPRGSSPVAVEDASITNIRRAFERWFSRCKQSDKNVAIMYFAGHGMECASKLLLASDFLEDQSSPMTAVIDCDLTFKLMHRCPARHQFFFVDACRLPNDAINFAQPGDLLHISNARPLPMPTGSNFKRNSLQLFATQMGKQAFGDSGAPSRFAKALRDHLDQLGASKAASVSSADWLVDHEHLGNYLLKSMHRDDKLKQRPLSDMQEPEVLPQFNFKSSVIHKLAGVPIVPIRFGCKPESANPFADFLVTDENGTAQPLPASKHGKEPFDAPLQPGTYYFEASFLGGSNYKRAASRISVDTPFTDYDVDVL